MAPPPPRRSVAAASAAAAAIARAARSAPSLPASSSPPPRRPVPSTAASSSAHGRAHVVRLLTFNLWFEPLAMRARLRAVGALVERVRPAVIGFQEVTRETLAVLKAQRWARYYDCSADTAPPFSDAYFVVLFSALPVRALTALPFANTGMGRELLAVRVELAPRTSLVVATAHLESLPQFARARVAQLAESLAFLRERVHDDQQDGDTCLGAVLMGDTNLVRGDMALLDPRCAPEQLTVEAATTGRAACRVCHAKIAKDAMRVGKMAKDRLPTGKTVETTLWFHHECFLSDATTSEAEKRAVRKIRDGVDDVDDGAATRGLPRHWRDLWLSVPGHTEANGFTYDGKRNALIKNKAFQSRLDRVYFYAPTRAAHQAFESIEMVGTEPIAEGLWMSDHFGLLTTLCFDAAVLEAGSAGDAKRKREDDQEEDEDERTQDRHEGPPKRQASGSKHAPIELE